MTLALSQSKNPRQSDPTSTQNSGMTISIVDHNLPSDTHNLYDVSFYNDQILTLVTHSAPMVESWLSEIIPIVNQNPIVGLDVEWRPNYLRPNGLNTNHRIATLQLCMDHRCLIFQLIYARTIPRALFDFLANGSYTFVGAGIEKDMEKLLGDYHLKVSNTADLGPLAATKLGKIELEKAGLKGLSKEILGKELQKPKGPGDVSRSRWDNEWLEPDQVQYACIDAFISSEVGRRLTALAVRGENSTAQTVLFCRRANNLSSCTCACVAMFALIFFQWFLRFGLQEVSLETPDLE